ncbi:MAG: DUF4360 domain-containing protein [Candidatus Electrothrix sp. AW2]|nr:DUF4360 domain-containing protein [Candidatus Electrothrix gigas]
MKKIFTSSFATVVCIAFVIGQAFARPPVYFKAPIIVGGTGCPQGSYTVSGNGTDTITILFDRYDAAKPTRNAASGMFRTACSFVVPVSVPSGYQISNLTADWRGYAEGRTKLHREYFIAGQRGPSANSSPRGDYTLRDNLMHETWNKCGRGVVPMRVNSSIWAKSNPSYISVDTVDLKNKPKVVLTFRLNWRQCR